MEGNTLWSRKTYEVFKRQVERYEAEKGILTWILIASLIVAIVQVLLGGKVWMIN